MHMGGWYDIFAAGTIENFVRLRAEAATDEARQGQRLLMGPWAHASYGDIIGDLEFGPTAGWGKSFDPTAWHLASFDEHLRGIENEDVAPVRIFLMGANTWLDETEWPPAGVALEDWHLHSPAVPPTRAAATASSHACNPRKSSRTGSRTTPPILFRPTARHASPAARWACTPARRQRELEPRADVLVYTSEPLECDLDVIGSVEAVLYVDFGADTDFTAKLVDVRPDGRAYLICDGIRALRHRESLDVRLAGDARRALRAHRRARPDAEPLFSGARTGSGSRCRARTSLRFARNPNNGTAPTKAVAADLTPARQVVHHDSRSPSRLVLPVRG